MNPRQRAAALLSRWPIRNKAWASETYFGPDELHGYFEASAKRLEHEAEYKCPDCGRVAKFGDDLICCTGKCGWAMEVHRANLPFQDPWNRKLPRMNVELAGDKATVSYWYGTTTVDRKRVHLRIDND